MRKITIFLLLILCIWGAYTFIENGFSYGNFHLSNFSDLENKSTQLKSEIASLETKNKAQYEAKRTALSAAVKNYKDRKEQYETLLAETEALRADEPELTSVDLYDIDFLWTIIGNYATEEGVILQFDVTKSASVGSSKSSSSQDYIFCDLNFTVTGEYIPVTDFIYDIEDDSRLNFEIRDFSLTKVEEELQKKGEGPLKTTFVVKSVPINTENLSTLTTPAKQEVTGANTNTVNISGTITK